MAARLSCDQKWSAARNERLISEPLPPPSPPVCMRHAGMRGWSHAAPECVSGQAHSPVSSLQLPRSVQPAWQRDDATVILGGDDATLMLGGDDAMVMLGGDDATVMLGGDDATVMLGGPVWLASSRIRLWRGTTLTMTSGDCEAREQMTDRMHNIKSSSATGSSTWRMNALGPGPCRLQFSVFQGPTTDVIKGELNRWDPHQFLNIS
jgi:hypothetical protein